MHYVKNVEEKDIENAKGDVKKLNRVFSHPLFSGYVW